MRMLDYEGILWGDRSLVSSAERTSLILYSPDEIIDRVLAPTSTSGMTTHSIVDGLFADAAKTVERFDFCSFTSGEEDAWRVL